jgi:hypothetical protein
VPHPLPPQAPLQQLNPVASLSAGPLCTKCNLYRINASLIPSPLELEPLAGWRWAEMPRVAIAVVERAWESGWVSLRMMTAQWWWA